MSHAVHSVSRGLDDHRGIFTAGVLESAVCLIDFRPRNLQGKAGVVPSRQA